MKINGGNYDEEDVAASKAITRAIFQKIEEGKTLNEGRMVEVKVKGHSLAEAESPILKSFDREVVHDQGSPEKKEAVLASSEEPPIACSPAAHRWSEPTTASVPKQRTSVICKECNLVLATEKQGSASEVMAELLKQIPH